MLSLLRLAQGRVEEAATSIRRAIDERSPAPSWMASPNSPVARLALLPAAVEVLLAAGDTAGARRAADELTQLSDQFKTASARASAASAEGAVALAEGAVETAAHHLREAAQLWAEVDAPYELARTRLVLADAYRRDNAADRAVLEVRAARVVFEALGARLDQQRSDELLKELQASGQALPTGMATTRVVRTFMFTDIVESTRLAESLGDAEWDTVIRAHDRVIRASAAEHGGVEVKATGDGFFVAFPDTDGAIQAAIGMQRLLTQEAADSRPTLPAVRIGIHRAEANRVGLDYVGSGVNQAARIGGAANGGEILVSTVTLTDVRREVPTSDRRSLTLKGIGQPVEVASVDWR